MKTSLFFPARFLKLLSAFLLLASTAAAGEFRAGAAKVDITPPNGTPMAGFYFFRASTEVFDPIYAKTIVVEQDGVRAAFVVLDLVTTTQPIVATARRMIEKECGIPGKRVMISATHTHSAPVLPRASLIDDLTGGKSPEAQAYADALPGLIAKSVSEALAKLAPATASATVGKAEGIAFNRRVIGRDGKLIWQPKKIDPALERPAGPVDPDLGLLVFDSAAQHPAPLAAYVNFGMHPISMGSGTRISADYPGELTKLLAERKGEEMIAVFANGCCGDINNTNYLTDKPRLKGPDETHRLGLALADVAVQSWPNLKRLETHAPRGSSVMVTLPRRKFSEEEIAKAKDIVSRSSPRIRSGALNTEKLSTIEMAEAVCIMETVEKKEIPLQVEVQAISFSDDLAILSLPGEIFVELGLAIKAASPFKHTFIAELANGSMGYVPNRDAYPQGSYEVVSACGEAGSGEMLVNAALKLLKGLAKS